MQELSESPALSQRAVYADVRSNDAISDSAKAHLNQIFGFKYTMSNKEIQLDPSQQINMRYHLYGQAIHRKGQAQMKNTAAVFSRQA